MKKSVFNRNIFRIFVLILSVIFAFTSCAPEIVNLPKNQSVNKKDNSKFKIEYDSESFSIKKFSDYKIKSISSKIIFEQNDFSFNEHFFNRLQVYILSFNMENETGQKLTTNTLNVSYQIGSGPYLAMKDSPPEKYNIKNDPSSGISEQYKQWEYDLESILKPIEATLIQDNDDNCSGSSISYVNFSGRELLFPVQKFNFVHSSYDDIPVEVFKSNNDTRKKDYFYSWSDYVEGRPKSQKQQPYEYFGNFSSFPLPQINGKIRLLINATKRTGPNEIYRGFENDESNFIKSQPFEISQEQNVTFNEQSLKNNFNVYITSSVSETYNATLKSLSDNTFIDWVNHRKEASTRIINPDSFISIDKRYLKSGQYQLNIQFCKSGISKTYNFNVDCSTPAISKEVNNSFSVLAIPIPNGSYESRCGEPVDEENGEDFPLPTPTPGPSNDCIEKLLPNQLTGGSGFSVSSSSGLVGYVQNVADYTSQIKDKAILYNKSVTQVDKLNVKLVELQMKPQTKSVINQIADLKSKRSVVYGEMNSVSIPLNYTLLPNLQSNYDSIKNTADSLTQNESDGYVSPNPHDETSLFSLQKYKDYIEEYDSEFEDYIYSENTYGMVSASRAIFKESRLYRDLVIQFLNQSVSKIVEEPDGDITEETKLDTLTTGLQVIKYLSNRINSHNTKLNNKISQLQQEVQNLNDGISTIKTELEPKLTQSSLEVEKESQLLMLFLLEKNGFLNTDTYELNESGFNIQGFRIKVDSSEPNIDHLDYSKWLREKSATVLNGVIQKYGSASAFMHSINDPVFETVSQKTGISKGTLETIAGFTPYPQEPEDLAAPVKGIKKGATLTKEAIEAGLTVLNKLKEGLKNIVGGNASTKQKIKDAVKNIDDKIKEYEKKYSDAKKNDKLADNAVDKQDKIDDACKKGDCLEKDLVSITGSKYKKHDPNPPQNKNLSENELKKKTSNGEPGIYNRQVDISYLEKNAWQNGEKTIRNDQKIYKSDVNVGYSEGKETKYLQIKRTGNEIHGHPITEERYNQLKANNK